MNKKIISFINKMCIVALICISILIFKEVLAIFMNIKETIDILKALTLFLSDTVIVFIAISLLKEESE